jgi:hypothetical protein
MKTQPFVPGCARLLKNEGGARQLARATKKLSSPSPVFSTNNVLAAPLRRHAELRLDVLTLMGDLAMAVLLVDSPTTTHIPYYLEYLLRTP